MFAAMGSPVIDRKPAKAWFFTDNFITGIWAGQGHEHSHTGFVLPYNTPEDQRDQLCWAFEQGQHTGQQSGERDMRDKFKRLLDL